MARMEFTGPKPTGTTRQPKLVTDRRNSVRLMVHSPAYANLDGSSPERARDFSEILDISEDGISIQTGSRLELDRKLNLTLDLSETKTRISTTGRVIWSNGSGRAGINFLKLSGQSLRQLKEWLFVNVLTAFDHSGGANGLDAGSNGASAGSVRLDEAPLGKAIQGAQRGALSPPNGTQRNELASSLPEDAHDGVAEPDSIRRELEMGGYGREAALQLIAKRALTLTRATGAAIALSVGDEMICQASAGSDAPPVGARLQASSGFSGECVRTGRCLRCDDSETDERVDREGCRILGVRSIVAVPIRPASRVVGLMEVFSSQPYAFTPQDISLLQHLTGIIVSAMDRGATMSAPAPALPRAPLPGTQRPTVQPPRNQEISSPDVMAGTMAATKVSPHPRFHKILLAAAAVTFLFALLWSLAPWFSGRISQARTNQAKTNSPGNERQTTATKPAPLPGDVNDLAGLRKLAEQGDPAAQFALGARFATGEEVKQDYSEAVRWFSMAADRGHILAQATLGAYYWAGRGVPPDLTKAYFWSALAQAGGDQASKYRVAVLTSRMSRSEILTAQQQANDWLRNHQTAGNASPSSR